jgi:hypothetical protein
MNPATAFGARGAANAHLLVAKPRRSTVGSKQMLQALRRERVCLNALCARALARLGSEGTARDRRLIATVRLVLSCARPDEVCASHIGEWMRKRIAHRAGVPVDAAWEDAIGRICNSFTRAQRAAHDLQRGRLRCDQ